MKVWKTDSKYSKYSYNKRMTIRQITGFSTAIKARREWNKTYNEQRKKITANIECILRKTYLQEWDLKTFSNKWKVFQQQTPTKENSKGYISGREKMILDPKQEVWDANENDEQRHL